MQFLVIGLDADDEQAAERRQAARSAHIALGNQLVEAGNLWYSGALLNEAGEMNGSVYLVDFADLQELEEWLEREPYVAGGVWAMREVRRCMVRDPWQFSRPRSFFESRAS